MHMQPPVKPEGSRSSRISRVVSDTSRSPNRTIDDSAGSKARSRRKDLRDPLRAPGQFPPYARRKTHLESDESYGDTEIPKSQRGGAAKRGRGPTSRNSGDTKARPTGRKPNGGSGRHGRSRG